MQPDDRHFTLRLARDCRDLAAAQRLRYQVFVEELGADGPLVDHAARLERDAFDEAFDHLLLIDTRRDAGALEDVVGVYRLLPGAKLLAGQKFYSESEFDLSVLRASGRELLELGRSCVHADYRRGSALLHLWNSLAEYVLARGIEVMFGAASFHGTDVAALAQPLAYLHHTHLAPEALRVRAIGPQAQPMDLVPIDALDRRAALLGTPALIKAYLRLGGFVGDGAYIDRDFNTIDVCLVMDTAQMSARHRQFYERKKGPSV
ncbi:GNAT family N-acetyltransferase [Pseudorhodobacter sp.]|uniref:GNAT family N-acetyltransferase n=1 Tax=Pseudorhodobacter sp. TaxID=1934400 RepID=UPI002AFFA0E0|nr:GNAT family N-acyltransferase [Pseudorhodobacter sp.]